jgi:hypothetical protein
VRRCLLLVVLTACESFAGGGGGGGDDDPRTDARGSGSGSGSGSGGTDVFAATTTKVTVEIDYETGEAPYTGNALGFGDTWAPTLTNIERLFASKKTLTIPTTLAEMEDIGAISDEELTVADLTAIASTHRAAEDTADTKTYYVVFVSGHFTDGNGPNNAVLGVSFGDTIAMFKDVIRSTADITNPNAVRYVEQSTMIHELAHSIGLVDNGVSMVAGHKDDAHGAHCTDPDCVMYWLNEGASEARAFALRRLLDGSTILFDAACLADVDALTGGP